MIEIKTTEEILCNIEKMKERCFSLLILTKRLITKIDEKYDLENDFNALVYYLDWIKTDINMLCSIASMSITHKGKINE